MSRASGTIVACYTLDGKLVKTYPSALKAARSRNLFKRTIDRCIRGDIKVVKELQWKRFKIDEVPETIPPLQIETKTLSIVPVAKIDDEGHILDVYPSIKNAAKINNMDAHTLRDRLNKKYPCVGKTKFRYLTDNEIIKYGFKKGKEFDYKAKPVIQYTLDGKYVKTYPSVRAATIASGRDPKNRGIHQCLSGQYDTAFGYVWKYRDQENVVRPRKHKIYIIALNNKNEIAFKFDTVREASAYFKVTVAAINNAIRLNQKIKGYTWIRK